MLNASNNELLTRVGAGTPMGALMRGYWLPALMGSELVADGRPVRVRLLGEALVAFRDSAGRVGVLEEHCPHRQVSLYFARNEECGLRCVYHGWKFDVNGKCLDLPSEPPGSPMQQRVKARAYPSAERGGVIWAYMGEGEPPALPDFEWALVPAQQRYMSKRLLECNWAQALEGDIDSSHASFLHSMLDKEGYAAYDKPARARYIDADGHPRYAVERRPYGMEIAARRDVTGELCYWRVAQFIMPCATLPAPYEDELYRCNFWVPRDDFTTMTYVIDWHPARAVAQSEIESRKTGLTAHCHWFEATDAWRPAANRDNDYQYEHARQLTDNYSGIREIWAQDKAVVESMGAVMDRTREHLGSSDLPITEFRRLMLAAIAQPVQPEPDAAAPSMLVRSATFTLPRETDWKAVAAEHTRAGVGLAPHAETV